MTKKLLAIIMFWLLCISPGFSDDDDEYEEHHEKRWYNIFRDHDDDDADKRKKGYSKSKKYSRYIPEVKDPLYLKECGACHFAFQPQLLPSASWNQMLSQLEDHFGDNASLTSQQTEQLRHYLLSNSAETSSAKRPRKILASIRGQIPLRITEVPYIQHKHDELPRGVTKRKSIKSLSNCQACHLTADRGIYSERYIHIPR